MSTQHIFAAGLAVAAGGSPAAAYQCEKPTFVEHSFDAKGNVATGVVLCPVGSIYQNYVAPTLLLDCTSAPKTVGACFDHVDYACGLKSNLRLTKFTRKLTGSREKDRRALGKVELYEFECTVPGKDYQ